MLNSREAANIVRQYNDNELENRKKEIDLFLENISENIKKAAKQGIDNIKILNEELPNNFSQIIWQYIIQTLSDKDFLVIKCKEGIYISWQCGYISYKGGDKHGGFMSWLQRICGL